MARPKKPHHAVTVRIEQNLYDALNAFCDDSGQSKTAAIERALKMYFEDYYEKQKMIKSAKAQ